MYTKQIPTVLPGEVELLRLLFGVQRPMDCKGGGEGLWGL